VTPPRCPAGHDLATRNPHRGCGRCRRQTVIAAVAAAEASLPVEQIAAVVDTVAASPQVLRSVAAALAADPAALTHGAPATVGRLVTELVARGAGVLTLPACAVCGRTGRPRPVRAVRSSPWRHSLLGLRRGQAGRWPHSRR